MSQLQRAPRWKRNLLLALLAWILGGTVFVVTACLAARTFTLLQLSLAGSGIALSAIVLVLTRTPRVRRVTLAVVALALVRLGGAVAPFRASENTGAPIRSVSVTGETSTTPWFSGIPERELVELGGLLLLTSDERRRSDALARIRGDYDELERASPFERPGPVVLDSWIFDRGHAWIAVPEGKGRFPLLVFLHGHVGNFQPYAKWLAQAARERGVVAVFPSWGFGRWETDAALARVALTVEHAERTLPIDRSRVFLVGLSNGCAGAYGSAGANPGRYAGLVAISGLPPVDPTAAAFQKTRTLVLHGAHDVRARIETVRRGVDALRASQADATIEEYPEDDHLLLLARREQVVARVLGFLGTTKRAD